MQQAFDPSVDFSLNQRKPRVCKQPNIPSYEVVSWEGNVLHDKGLMFCYNPSCPCHDSPLLIEQVARFVREGLLTPNEAAHFVAGRTIKGGTVYEPRIKRTSATRVDLEARRTGNALPTRTRNTADDDDILNERPGHLPTSTRRYPLPAPEREYMIPLTDGTALYVTERKLATMGRDYQAAAQQVTPGARVQRQPRHARPNPNRAQQTSDVIYAQPARSTQAPQAAYAPTPGERVRRLLGRVFIVLGIGMMIMMVGYVLLNILANWWQVQQDDWNYGRPRTFQIDWNVGHGTVSNPNSHFIAQNLNRKIVIIEIPADDLTHARIYIGPTLIGPTQDLTPVTLSFEDVNHDGHPDLIIHVEDSKFIFLNQQVKGVWQFVPAPNQ